MVRLQLFPCISYVLLLLVPLLTTNLTSAIIPDSSFTDHFVTYPRVYHPREKRSLSSSKDHREETGHLHDLIIELNLAGRNITLDLQLNRNLIPKQYFEKYQQNGDYIIKKPNFNGEKMELCHYNGHVRNVPDSWAAVSTCDGIKGVVHDGDEMHYVESAAVSSTERSGIASLDGPHLVYRQSDLASNLTCGTNDSLPSEVDHVIHAASTHRFKRDASNIRGPYNANTRSRFIELVLVIDHGLYEFYKRDMNKINRRCKDLANIINSLYEPLNIFVALVGVIIWTEKDEFSLEPNGDVILNHFLNYRRTQMNDHPNDNAQFLTNFRFEGSVVGKALKGPICTYEYSAGVNVDHSEVVGLVATTIAHEMGHNLGMEHDNDTTCKCPKERCIMAPLSSSLSPTDWSSCSQESLVSAFEHGMDYCLRNKPVSLFDGPVCGNSFVEPGEECDCGLKERCTNLCCDPTTCKLRVNATCATGECCDLQTCKLRDAAFECRSASNECDLPEFCHGDSEYCPTDVFKIDGMSCDGGTAFCYHGDCRSHTSQCKLLWGPSGSSSDLECYKLNNQGTVNGNCGFNRLTSTYQKCNDTDVECGMLQCKHATEKLQFGTELAAYLSVFFITTNTLTIPCRTAVIDLGLNDVDPGLTPDGAKCGDNRMCWNRKCMDIDSVRKMTVPDACPDNCNGNGVCNSLGQCHCNEGYAPPDCDGSGPGGSMHSGPAEDPQNYNKLRRIFWYVMLTLIPLVVVLLLYPRYIRKNPTYFWKRNQRRTVYVPCCRPSLPSFDIASVVGWFNCTHFFRTGTNDTKPTNSSHVNSTTTSTASTFSTIKIIHPHLKQSNESNSDSSTAYTVSVRTHSPSSLPKPSPNPFQGRQVPHSAIVHKTTKVAVDKISKEAINKTLKGAMNKTPKGTVDLTPKTIVSVNKTSKGTLNKTWKEAISKTAEDDSITFKKPMETANKISEQDISRRQTKVTIKTPTGATNMTPKGAAHIGELISKFEKS